MSTTPSQKPALARVLIADDEPVIAETLALILKRSGFDAAVAHNGQEAVKRAEVWQPHAVISDVMMPIMNGIDAAIAILSILPACRIILISGQAATVDLQRDAGLKGHFFEVLAKPVHPSELLDRLIGLQAAESIHTADTL